MTRILLLFFILATSRLCAQTITFNVMLFGDKVGQMTITRELRADSTEFYTMESRSKAKVLWVNKDNYTRYLVSYKGGKLLESRAMETENGELKRWVNVKWDGSKYQVDGYKGRRNFTDIPTFSVVSIFFNVPAQVKRVFYEAEGEFNTFEQTAPDTWQFKSSDGHTNVYHYKNGKISNVEFHVSIATVKLVRVN